MPSQVFTIQIDGVPEGWEPVAFRRPANGESFVSDSGRVATCEVEEWSFGPRLILRKKYTPEPWLKEAGFRWLVRCNHVWWAVTRRPIWNGSKFQNIDAVWIQTPGLNFTPPDLPEGTPDKDTLIALP